MLLIRNQPVFTDENEEISLEISSNPTIGPTILHQ